MKKAISTIGTALALSLALQACTPNADSDDQAEPAASNDLAIADAKHAAEKAALEAQNAARMSVMAAKLAVCSEAQKDKEAAAQLAAKAEAAAKLAAARVIEANAEIDLATNVNARKAQDLANEAVTITGDAVRETNASLQAGLQSDAVAAKSAAETAQKAAIKAAAATLDASKAAQVAAKETWTKEMTESAESE